jgi:parallel beta-helix repeat protein
MDVLIYESTFTIQGNTNWGILIGDSSQNISIYENIFTFEGEDNLEIYFSQNSTNCSVFENVFTFNNTGGTIGRTILFEDDSVGANITSNNITSTSYEVSPGIDIGSRSTNFYIEGNRINITGNESSGIRINDNSSSGTIYNNIINVSGNLNILPNLGRGGIFLEQGTSDMNVSLNTIYTYGINSTAIFVWGNTSIIDLNTIITSGIRSKGISLDGAEETNLTNNNITTTGNYSEGIFVGGSSINAKVYNNQINTSGVDAYGIYLNSLSSPNLSSNNLTGTGSYGIYSYDCTDALIYSNTISVATDYGVYDHISSSSNISTNIITATTGIGDYVFGIWAENATSANIDSNVLYENDDGGNLYCGGIGVWYANATLSFNTIYGDVNTSCNRTTGITTLLDSGKNSLIINNNEINSSAGNNSYGIIFTTADGSSNDTIIGAGNTIRNSDYCLHFEVGNFIFSGVILSNCGTYDIRSASNVLATDFNTTATIINSTVNVSKLNVSEYSNISLQEYVRGYVDDGTSALSSATVVLTNNNSAEQQWSKTTASNGYTSYGGATYYFYNSTGGYNYSSMTATTTKTGYTSNSVSSVISGQTTISISLTATDSSSSSSSSSSGGATPTASFWASTHSINDAQFKAGYTRQLAKAERIRISVNNEYHHVGIVDLTLTTATINISSNPMQAILSIGQNASLDINNDGIYDIYLLLNSIENNKANLTVKETSEKVLEVESVIKTQGEVTEDEDNNTGEEQGYTWLYWIIVGIIVVIIILAVIWIFLQKNNRYYVLQNKK